MRSHVFDQFDSLIYSGTREECAAHVEDLYLTGKTIRVTPRIEPEECTIDLGFCCAPDCDCAKRIEELTGEVMA